VQLFLSYEYLELDQWINQVSRIPTKDFYNLGLSHQPSSTMSSPDSSPAALPTTPEKERNMTVNKENTALRTPLPNAPVNGANRVNVRVEIDAPKNAGEVVQVPGTASPAEASAGTSDEAQKSDQVDEELANNAEETPSDSTAVGSESANPDLPAFDWNDLQHRYTKAIDDVNEQEDDILAEFERFSSVSLFNKRRNWIFAEIRSAGFFYLGTSVSKS
jgi:hypothetical protein